MRCPCGHPSLHITQEQVDEIREAIDYMADDLKKHLVVGETPSQGLIDAMHRLNLASGLAVVEMISDRATHEHLMRAKAKNN